MNLEKYVDPVPTYCAAICLIFNILNWKLARRC